MEKLIVLKLESTCSVIDSIVGGPICKRVVKLSTLIVGLDDVVNDVNGEL